jgi:hypothetical protein
MSPDGLSPMEGASLYGGVQDQTLDGFPYTLLEVNYKLFNSWLSWK